MRELHEPRRQCAGEGRAAQTYMGQLSELSELGRHGASEVAVVKTEGGRAVGG